MLSFNRKSLQRVLEENGRRAGTAFRVSMPATLPNILSPLLEDIAPEFPLSRPDRNCDDQPALTPVKDNLS